MCECIKVWQCVRAGRGEGERETLLYWERATFLVVGDMCVFHRTEAPRVRKRECQKLFTVLFQRTNCKGICDPSENLRKEKNKTKERARN